MIIKTREDVFRRTSFWLETPFGRILHNENDQPAVLYDSEIIEYWQNGNYHRNNNLPAIIHPDGFKNYHYKGFLHRINGPAVEHPNDNLNYYFYMGKEYGSNFTPESWTEYCKRFIFE